MPTLVPLLLCFWSQSSLTVLVLLFPISHLNVPFPAAVSLPGSSDILAKNWTNTPSRRLDSYKVHRHEGFSSKITKHLVFYFILFFFLVFFRVTPMTYGSSQARGQIQSCSCWPIPQPQPQPRQIQATSTTCTALGNPGSLTH